MHTITNYHHAHGFNRISYTAPGIALNMRHTNMCMNTLHKNRNNVTFAYMCLKYMRHTNDVYEIHYIKTKII